MRLQRTCLYHLSMKYCTNRCNPSSSSEDIVIRPDLLSFYWQGSKRSRYDPPIAMKLLWSFACHVNDPRKSSGPATKPNLIFKFRSVERFHHTVCKQVELSDSDIRAAAVAFGNISSLAANDGGHLCIWHGPESFHCHSIFSMLDATHHNTYSLCVHLGGK